MGVRKEIEQGVGMRWTIGLWILVVAVGAVDAQDRRKRGESKEEDQTKRLQAPQVIAKAVKEMNGLSAWHVKTSATGQQFSGEFEGTAKKDACAVQGSAEIYCKNESTLVKDGSRYVETKDLDMQTDTGRAALAFRNPALQFGDMNGGARSARFTEDETIGEIECRVIVLDLTKEQKRKIVEKLVSNISLPIPVRDPMQFIDLDATEADYRVWVGRKDLRIHKYIFRVKPELKGGLPGGGRIPGGGGGAPGVGNMEVKSTTECTKFGEDLEWEIPKEVKSRLGLR